MSVEYHKQAQILSNEALQARLADEEPRAAELYHRAALFEEAAFHALPARRGQTVPTIGESVVALYSKAGDFSHVLRSGRVVLDAIGETYPAIRERIVTAIENAEQQMLRQER